MNRWFNHKEYFYNLDKFKQICLGDDDEILLSNEGHNMDWEDEEKTCSLTYESKTARDEAYQIIKNILGLE